jgi:hypothetical protein
MMLPLLLTLLNIRKDNDIGRLNHNVAATSSDPIPLLHPGQGCTSWFCLMMLTPLKCAHGGIQEKVAKMDGITIAIECDLSPPPSLPYKKNE